MIITIPSTDKRQVIDITDKVAGEVGDQTGNVCLFAQHSTAAITTANMDPGTDLDLIQALESLLPPGQAWRHPHNPEHAPDHLLASLVGPSLVVPVKGGRLQLGTWQRIVLIEFDGPKERNIVLDVIGEVQTDPALML